MNSPRLAHDDDNDVPMSPRLRRSSLRSQLEHVSGSLRLQMEHVGEDHTRSIGGRLGGHFDASIRSIQGLTEDEREDMQVAGEETHLLPHDEVLKSPPLSVWIVPALLCALAYASYNLFIKKGSFTMHPILGGVVLQFVAALLGSALLGGIICQSRNVQDEIRCDRKGFMWSVCAGVAVGVAEMLSFCVSGMGVQATQFIPIIIGGAVAVGAVLGLLVLGEKMMLHGWFGVVLLVTGIGMVATDPGEKVEEGGGGSDGGGGSPPLIVWIFPALCCATAYALYNIFIKKGSASISPILGGVILQFVAAIFGSMLLGVIILKEGGTSRLEYDDAGLFWSFCAGIAVGAAELLSFTVSGMGVQATQSIPIIIGGSVGMGAVLGMLVLGETLMLQGWLGVALLMTGIGFVATDPGEKVAAH